MRQIAIAKISRPNARGVLPRKRLFRLLDGAGKQPILWVTGPAGSGKTSLIASYLDARELPCLWYQADERDSDIAAFFYYLGLAAKKAAPRYRKPLPLLTPEYLGGIPTFTQRFFENIFKRLKPPFALVFDNYQDVPEGSLLHSIVQNGLTPVPEGVRVIILSRNEPPATFSHLRAHDAVRVVGWDELRFTLDEAKQFVKRRVKLHDAAIEELYAKTEGWAGGLVLLTESVHIHAGTIPEDNPARLEVFDYFAGEVLDKLDAETRDFLIMSSLLPRMTVQAAINLTDCDNAAAILSALSRNNFFTEKRSAPEMTYQYHSLFREFLLARMKRSLSAEGLVRVQKRAAAVLKEAGQVEDAIELLSAAEDWNGLIGIILENARQLISQGRNRTLQEWIERLPDEVRAGNPWLLYWLAVSGYPFDLDRFEEAFRLFDAKGDVNGALLSWAGAVSAFLFELRDVKPLDRWLGWIEERIRGGITFASPEIEASVVAGMTGILALRKPDHPDKDRWLDRALSLAQTIPNIEASVQAYINCALFYIWMGEFARCDLVLREMRKMVRSHSLSPLRLISVKLMEAMLANWSGDRHGMAVRSLSEGLGIARETGISMISAELFLQGAISSLNQGDPAATGEYLRKAETALGEGRHISASHFFCLSAWHELVAGETANAVVFAKRSLHLVETTGLPFAEMNSRLALTHALYANSDHREARVQLDSMKDLVPRSNSPYLRCLYHLTEASCAFDRGDRSRGLEALRTALETGRRHDFSPQVYFWRPDVMSRLCAEAFEAAIEVDYARRLVGTLGLSPHERFSSSEIWPWPLRIATLRRFEVLKDGRRAGSGRKVQHKPLLMLKALIAFGGSEVPEEKITDFLWPDSEGDAAHSAFSTTLQRLRGLIGNDKALVLDGRRLTLDARLCWVDAWSFERMHERADVLWRGVHDQDSRNRERMAADAYGHGEKALELYQGSFLPGDIGHAWTAAYRERLRSKFLRLVLQQGLHLEESAQWRKAAETFERGLETDELAEEFYQRLMVCYQRLGQKAEAIRIYDTCRAVFSSALGIAPSQQTEKLYLSLLK